MAEGLRVVGAGLPRTGTRSLRAALERLLGGTCYHMSTLRERGYVDVATFTAAARDEHVDWSEVFAGGSGRGWTPHHLRLANDPEVIIPVWSLGNGDAECAGPHAGRRASRSRSD